MAVRLVAALNGNGDRSWQEKRCAVVRAFVEMEAPEIAALVAHLGWCEIAVRRATRCANSLLAVYGPGDYRIVTWDSGRTRSVRQDIAWMPTPYRR